jgi:hypothetical protein
MLLLLLKLFTNTAPRFIQTIEFAIKPPESSLSAPPLGGVLRTIVHVKTVVKRT